jgi:hypothetical protein
VTDLHFSPGSRVQVRLPGVGAVPGRLQGRKQLRHEGGYRWVFVVMLEVPADAVSPVEGESYGRVPTRRADRWVITPTAGPHPDVHAPGCSMRTHFGSRETDTAGARAAVAAGASLCKSCDPQL